MSGRPKLLWRWEPTPKKALLIYTQASYEASLIPAIDCLRSLGIVWIPGLMAGILLSGSRPIYAAIYQFVVLIIGSNRNARSMQ